MGIAGRSGTIHSVDVVVVVGHNVDVVVDVVVVVSPPVVSLPQIVREMCKRCAKEMCKRCAKDAHEMREKMMCCGKTVYVYRKNFIDCGNGRTLSTTAAVMVLKAYPR